MKTHFRTKAAHDRHQQEIEQTSGSKDCPLCSREPLVEFRYWKIINNEFPYDLIASTHHMLVPKRHTKELDFVSHELEEFSDIKHNQINNYEYIIETIATTKSIPDHFHLHLLISKQ